MTSLLRQPTRDLARKLKALDHDTRYKIIDHLLSNGESSFTDITDTIEETKTATVYHLEVLVNAGLLAARYMREGREYAHYSVTDDAKNLFSKLGLTSE